jgi:hypothetical protein
MRIRRSRRVRRDRPLPPVGGRECLAPRHDALARDPGAVSRSSQGMPLTTETHLT